MPAASIKERIKAIRKALCLSQKDFCKGIFLSRGFYSQLESGIKSPNERIYELICNKYKINKNWLLTGGGDMFSAPPSERETEQLIEIYRELDPLFKEYVLQQIKQLLSVQKRGKEQAEK